MEIVEVRRQEANEWYGESVTLQTTVGNKVLEVTIYGVRRAFGSVQGAEINWAAYGSQSPEIASAYAELLTAAVARAATLSGPLPKEATA